MEVVIMEKGVEISPELEQQIARNVKRAMRDELKEEIRTSLYRMKPEMEQEISAGASEAICALNWRIAEFTKKYGSFMDDVKRLVDQLECQTIGPETEKPIEEEAPGVEAKVKPQEAKPETESTEKTVEKVPAEPEKEVVEFGERVGYCPRCFSAFNRKEMAQGYTYCPFCLDEPKVLIRWRPDEPFVGVCPRCRILFSKEDLDSDDLANLKHGKDVNCPKCKKAVVWFEDQPGYVMDTSEEKTEKTSEGLEPICGHCETCSLGFDEEDKAAKIVRCTFCGDFVQWD